MASRPNPATPLKIWILEIGEPLPMETDVRMKRYGQLSQFLASRGHDVTWWASSFSHTPKQHFSATDQDVDHQGVRLRLIRGPGYRRNVSLARIWHNQHFARRFAERAPTCEEPDLIIAPIPTIEAAAEAVRFANRNDIAILTDIRDLWPDEITGRVPGPLRPFARLALSRAYRQMSYVCRNVDGIMGVSNSYIDYGLKFAGRARGELDFFVPLGYSGRPVEPRKLEEALTWCKDKGVRDDAFVICFFGKIGHFFDLETVIEAARRLGTDLPKERPVQFVLGGDGSELERFKVLGKGIPSVLFLGWLDAPKIAAVMQLSKAGLAPYRRDANMTLPNKPFEYMAGGLPLISSIQRELPELLERHRCGLTYRADSVAGLCAAIRSLYENEPGRAELGARARRLFEDRFQTETIFADLEEKFQALVSSKVGRKCPRPPGVPAATAR
ncbi:MAG TPA: glycosyltransferase family 4 protein [Longimicrobium sp.]|nr:glycosyltransferase family 4 protein [Longimicrobium sp.]